MRNLYWIGGSGSAGLGYEVGHLSLASGGDPLLPEDGSPYIEATDNITFDSGSLNGGTSLTVTLQDDVACNNISWTVSGTLTSSLSNMLSAYGNVYFSAGDFVDISAIGTGTINFSSRTMTGALFIEGSYSVSGSLKCASVQVSGASIAVDFNAVTITVDQFAIACTGTVDLANCTINAKVFSASTIDAGDLTLTGSIINIEDDSGTGQFGAYYTFPEVNMLGDTSYIYGTPTFTKLKIKTSSDVTIDGTITYDKISCNGVAGNLTTFTSNDANWYVVKIGTGNVTWKYVDLNKSVATINSPQDTYWYAENSTDNGDNYNWIFGATPYVGNVYAYDSATSAWVLCPVYTYDSATSAWVETPTYTYDTFADEWV